MPDRAFFEREVTRESCVVLEFPEGRPWSALMYQLPEAYILSMAAELVAAAAQFRQLAVQLVGALERHLGVETAGLLDPELAHLATALPKAFHDTRRAISVLARNGHLVLHEGERDGWRGNGGSAVGSSSHSGQPTRVFEITTSSNQTF